MVMVLAAVAKATDTLTEIKAVMHVRTLAQAVAEQTIEQLQAQAEQEFV
jgi:hypothetical protein